VVDNDSKDDTVSLVQGLEPRIGFPLKTIRSQTNLGFARANHLALRYASKEYVTALNPDTKPEPAWLGELAGAMSAHPEVGICASKMMRDDGTGTIDTAGDGFSTLLKGFKRGEGLPGHRFNRGDYVFGACGGAALYRRKMIDDIGFFDEDFFLIHEDTDLSFRAQLSGWRVLYVPGAVVYHRIHGSIGRMSDMAAYFALRNIELVRIKNIPALVLARFVHLLAVNALLELLYFVVKHGKLRAYARAKWDVLRMLPALLKKRSAIMARRRLSSRDLVRMLTPVHDPMFAGSKLHKMLRD